MKDLSYVLNILQDMGYVSETTPISYDPYTLYTMDELIDKLGVDLRTKKIKTIKGIANGK